MSEFLSEPQRKKFVGVVLTMGQPMSNEEEKWGVAAALKPPHPTNLPNSVPANLVACLGGIRLKTGPLPLQFNYSCEGELESRHG
jgi:hypothetical protein